MPSSTLILATTDAESSTYVMDVLAILGTSAAVAILMQRVRLAVIPAYLIAGALVGPFALRLVRSADSLDSISSLAILLLMFGIGLHLHLAALGRSLLRMIAIGVVSCLLTIVALWPIAMAFGVRAPAALVVCMAMSMSSTAVVLRLIAERGELKHTTGRLALAILVVQDMLVIPMLAALPALGEWAAAAGAATTTMLGGHDGQRWPEFVSEAALSLGAISALVVIGRLVLPRLLREAARERTGEVMMIASIATALGAGVATQALGFSPELGAFLAGFLLAGTPFRHQISGQIAPLRDLFMAVFFTTLGMHLDMKTLAESWWVVLLGGALMAAVKMLAIGGTAWSLGATPAMSIAVAFALAQGGEFGLVLLATAQDRGVVDDAIIMNASAIIIISLILTPALMNFGRQWSERLHDVRCAPWIAGGLQHQPEQHAQHTAHAGRHAIVGGYGQVGRRLVESLEQAGIACTVVELNRECVTDDGASHADGPRFVFGDVSNREVLESAGLEDADALALTMPDEQSVLRACAIAKRLRPGIQVFARINFASQSRIAQELGADLVIVEELECAKAMQHAVLSRLAPTPEASLQ